MADKTIPAFKILRGNVGINTATPTEKLHVDGGGYLEGDVVRDGGWHRGLEITTENADYASLFFGNQIVGKYSGIIWTSSTSGNTSNKRGAQIYAAPTSAINTDLGFATNDAVGTSSPSIKMYIRGNGNVGIGLTNPASQLHIRNVSSSTNSYSNVIRIESQSTGTTTTGFGVQKKQQFEKCMYLVNQS